GRMDATAWRAVLVTFGLFAAVGIVFLLGKTGVLGVSEQLEASLSGLREGPWGLPATIGVFCVAAFVGAPQFVLIAAAVVAFGPIAGFFYAWTATLCSATLTFWAGRFAGAETLRRFGGRTANRMSRFIGRNDFLASLIVRNVPTAPFIVVNMAFGVSHARYWRYLAGLAIGIIPKAALVAFAGQSALSAVSGSPWIAAFAAAVAAGLWILIVIYARRAVRGEGRETADAPSASAAIDPPPSKTEA
ncbi:MAG: VTT domain-containing protein, partial [Pseudomonadota bacterium]